MDTVRRLFVPRQSAVTDPSPRGSRIEQARGVGTNLTLFGVRETCVSGSSGLTHPHIHSTPSSRKLPDTHTHADPDATCACMPPWRDARLRARNFNLGTNSMFRWMLTVYVGGVNIHVSLGLCRR